MIIEHSFEFENNFFIHEVFRLMVSIELIQVDNFVTQIALCENVGQNILKINQQY